MKKTYYVYQLIDKSTGIPFYVGKGVGNRMYQHVKDAQNKNYVHIRSVHSKILSLLYKGIEIEYVQTMCESEEEAFVIEQRMIAEIGRKDQGTGPLCNLTNGGEGVCAQSADTIKKRADWHRGKRRSVESKTRMSISQLNRRISGYVTSDSTKAKCREALSAKSLQTANVKQKRTKNQIKCVHQYTLDGTYVQTFASAKDAAQHIGQKNDGNIKSCCRHVLSEVGGFVWRYEVDEPSPTLMRAVAQLDHVTNIVVRIWNTLSEAAMCVGVSNSRLISGIKHTTIVAGYKWQFADGQPARSKKLSPVDQYDLDGKFMRSWNSATSAGHELNINYTGIVRCCRKYLHTSGGFIWRYANDKL